MAKTLSLACILPLLWMSAAVAQQEPSTVRSVVTDHENFFIELGGYATLTVKGHHPYMEIVLRKDMIIRNTATMVVSGLFNTDLGQTVLGELPYYESFHVAEQATAYALSDYYDGDFYAESRLDPVHVVVELIDDDQLGHDRYRKLFSMDFNGELAARIDWAHFNPRNFYRVAPNFRGADWLKPAFYSEEYGMIAPQ